MEESPIFDELEAKWSQVALDRRICDEYWRVSNVQTGAEWYEDDEGNEVFPEVHAYLVPQEVQPGDTVNYLGGVGQPQYAEGGVVVKASPEAQRMLENFDSDCPVAIVPKRKFKLFGRNQDCNGCL